MMFRIRMTVLAAAGATVLGTLTQLPASAAPTAPAAPADPVQAKERIEVFGHRGASGYRPEHTLAAYELAARMGADYIEPDLVSTTDGVLVSRHENEISTTTDVARHPEFADRKTTKVIDGVRLTGWFTEDFTLAELKTLRTVERIPELRPGNTVYNGQFEIPTLQEVIDLKKRLSAELGRDIGIAPETKHPSYFDKIDRPIEPGLITTLDANGLNTPDSNVAVQSFEVGNLKRLDRASRVELVQLIDASGAPRDFIESGDPRTYADLVTPDGLREIAGYAETIGPDTSVLLPTDEQDYLTEPTRVAGDAHDAGLKVVPYTVRAENEYLPADFRSSDVPTEHGDANGFFRALFAQRIDGIFSDQPDLAVQARDQHANR